MTRLRDQARIWGPALLVSAALPWIGVLPLRFELGSFQATLDLYHLTSALLFVTFALGVAIVVGQVGLLDLGFFAFVAAGAYTMVILLLANFGHEAHLPWGAILPLCALNAVLLRGAVGAPALRLRGDYLAIVTLAFGEIYLTVLRQNPLGLTGGPNGRNLVSIGRSVFNPDANPAAFYYAALALAASAALFLFRVRNSRVGRAWRAIRQDEVAALASGIPVFRYRLLAYVAGGVFAGLGGGLSGLYNISAHPSNFTFMESVKVVAMVVLGGMETVIGPIAGALIFVLGLEIFRDLARYRMLVFGIVLVLLMRYRPDGIFGRRRT